MPRGGAASAAKAPEQPIEVLMAAASVEKGQATAKQCAACHTFEKGGPNRVGPNLWGIVDRPRASEAGFNYSAAMKAKGGKWTYRRAQQVPGQSARLHPGHGDELRRPGARAAARRRDRLSAHSGGQPGAAAEGGGEAARNVSASEYSPRAAGPKPGRCVIGSRPAAFGHADLTAADGKPANPPLVADRKTDIITGDCVADSFFARAGEYWHEVHPTIRHPRHRRHAGRARSGRARRRIVCRPRRRAAADLEARTLAVRRLEISGQASSISTTSIRKHRRAARCGRSRSARSTISTAWWRA